MPEIPVAPIAGRSPEELRGPWWVVVPVKTGARAKSRLAVDPRLRARLASAFTLDTVSALLESDRVAGVIAVLGGLGGLGGLTVLRASGQEDADHVATLRARGVLTVDEPTRSAGDLNSALRAGITAVHGFNAGAPVALVLGDLPALRPGSVSRALEIALRAGGPVFVADASGHGTTLLACAGTAPQPRFGQGSAAAHRTAGAREISALVADDLRCDVDTAADLDAALHLGVGPATRAVLDTRDSPSVDPPPVPHLRR